MPNWRRELLRDETTSCNRDVISFNPLHSDACCEVGLRHRPNRFLVFQAAQLVPLR
jgi:hypothetical protein